MRPVTTRIPDDTYRTLSEEADERDESVSALVRKYVEKGMDYDDLENERDRLQRQLTATNAREEDVKELATFVEDERIRRRRQQAREDARASATPWRRLKWWATGTDPADTLERDRDGVNSEA